MRVGEACLAIGLVAVPCTGLAEQDKFAHCTAFIQAGIRDVTRQTSANHAIVLKYQSNCGLDLDKQQDAQAFAAEAEIFAYGSGGASTNASHARERVRQWCNQNKDFAESNANLAEEASIINAPSVQAWTKCIDLATKHVKISVESGGSASEQVNITVDSTIDTGILFSGIEARGFTCTWQAIEGENVVNNPQSFILRNENIHISCQRTGHEVEMHESGARILRRAEGYISVRTAGDALNLYYPATEDANFFSPPNSVMAFASACPKGWVPFENAIGRTIIGAGGGAGLERRNLLDVGGAERVTLTIDEMPRHSHSLQMDEMLWGGKGSAPYADNRIANGTDLDKEATFAPSGQVLEAGGGQSHDNMPPWIALNYCRKI